MKRRKIRDTYTPLKAKVFLQTIGLAFAAIVMIVLVYNFVWVGRGADFTVWVIQNLFNKEYYDAIDIYRRFFRNNAVLIMLSAVMFAFLGLIWFFLSWFTKYFNEIHKGIDALLDEEDKVIILPTELRPVELKLNTVRQNLKNRAQEAQLAEQRKNDLVMYLAHDIRTPLTSVIGYLSLLEEAPDMPVEQKAKYIHITLEKAIRLETLVNEFFEITRYSITQAVPDKVPIDLSYLLVQLSDEFYPLLSAKGNTAILEADENLTLQGDPIQLARAFGNILKNAAAYSYPNTAITICAQKKEADIRISFHNKGKTLSKEKLSIIFDKFYRLDESRSSDTGGAGLGLPIAKEIIQLHGGTITAESEDNNICFIIFLPISS